MDENDLGILKWVLPFAFVPLWLFVCWGIAKVGGWKTLAKAYARDVYGEVEWKILRSATLGVSNYKSSLNFGITREYLYIKPVLVFRFGHDPVGIPWRDITIKETKFLFVKTTELTFAKCPDLKLLISSSLAKSLKYLPTSPVS